MRITNLMLCAVLLATTSCGKKPAASNDFAAAMQDVHVASQEMTRSFSTTSQDIDRLSAHDAPAAARRVETELIPLLDRMIGAMERAQRSGRAYLDAAGDEDPDVLATIRKRVDGIDPMHGKFVAVRALLIDEARLLHAGPLSAADHRRIGFGILDAMSGH